MTPDEAVALLSSDSAHERLKGARFLSRAGQPDDLPAIHQARQKELVYYVKKALDLAITKLTQLSAPVTVDPADEVALPEHVRVQIRSHAIEQVAGILLHEIASPIGLVKSAASREIREFATSDTKKYLDSLERIFEAMEQLKGAITSPKPEEFDLSAAIQEMVSAESTEATRSLISLHGRRPFNIRSDPALVSVVVCNGIRNAIEAAVDAQADDPHSIVITWGDTDVEYWVVVLDRGRGVIGPIEAAFEIGKTTKRGHSGFGLAIAKQAVETLGGSVTLQPAAGSRGTRYEVRWAK